MRIFAQERTRCRIGHVPTPPGGDNTWRLVAVLGGVLLRLKNDDYDPRNRYSPEYFHVDAVDCYWQREQDLSEEYRR